MVYMDDGMQLDADIGGLGQGLIRACCAGESLFRLHLRNESSTAQKVGISPKFPAKIIPIDLALHSGLIINRGAFLAAVGADWHIRVVTARSLGIGLFAGQGFFMNTLWGS